MIELRDINVFSSDIHNSILSLSIDKLSFLQPCVHVIAATLHADDSSSASAILASEFSYKTILVQNVQKISFAVLYDSTARELSWNE